MKPGLGHEFWRACWSSSAIIPAISGVDALVPPTYAMGGVCPPGQLLADDEHTTREPGLSSAKSATSGTILYLDCGVVGSQPGRASKVLTPPPPPAALLYGVRYAVSFQTPEPAIELFSASVRFVPPAASTQADV